MKNSNQCLNNLVSLFLIQILFTTSLISQTEFRVPLKNELVPGGENYYFKTSYLFKPAKKEWLVDALIPINSMGEDSLVMKIISDAKNAQFKVYPQGYFGFWYPAVRPNEIDYFLKWVCCVDTNNCTEKIIQDLTTTFLRISFSINISEPNNVEIQGFGLVWTDPGGLVDNMNLLYVPRKEFRKVKLKLNNEKDFISWLQSFEYSWIPIYIQNKWYGKELYCIPDQKALNHMCKVIYAGTSSERESLFHNVNRCVEKSINTIDLLKLTDKPR